MSNPGCIEEDKRQMHLQQNHRCIEEDCTSFSFANLRCKKAGVKKMHKPSVYHKQKKVHMKEDAKKVHCKRHSRTNDNLNQFTWTNNEVKRTGVLLVQIVSKSTSYAALNYILIFCYLGVAAEIFVWYNKIKKFVQKTVVFRAKQHRFFWSDEIYNPIPLCSPHTFAIHRRCKEGA